MDLSIRLLLNLLLNSIPEEIYVVLFCLVLIGIKKIKFDWKLVTSILVPAIISNICRYILNINMSIVFIIFVMTMCLTIVLCYKKYTLKTAGLVIISTVIACVINVLLELINYGILMKCAGITELILKDSIFIAFISSLPFRLLEIGTVILYIKMRKDLEQKIRVNLWQTILKNKKQRILAIIVSIFNIFWVAASLKIFGIDKILLVKSIDISTALLIMIGDVLVPVLLYIFLVYTIYITRKNEVYLKRLNKGFIFTHANVAKYYIESGKYRKAISVLDEIETIEL